MLACRACDRDTLLARDHPVCNLYTPESNYRKGVSNYNREAVTKSVSAIRDPRVLGGAQDDREERERLSREIAEGKEVGLAYNPCHHSHGRVIQRWGAVGLCWHRTGHLRGAQDDREERERLSREIAEGKEVGLVDKLSGKCFRPVAGSPDPRIELL